jgi:beta-mannosidase
MFREWRSACKALLKEKRNTLIIRFRDVFDENLPKHNSAPFRRQAYANNDQADVKIALYSRKAQFHYGWDWGPRLITCGVWRPVFFEGWSSFKIRNLQIMQVSVTAAEAEITSILSIESAENQKVNIQITADSTLLCSGQVTLRNGDNRVALTGKIVTPKLWWTNGLGEQYLYKIRASVTALEGHTDTSETKVGIRSLEVVRQKDSIGTSMFIRLNGVPVFMKGADYIPQDNFQSRVTRERYEHMIRSAAQANMNMLRVWGGGIYEDDLFYDLCDSYGILIWHDLMFACAMYPADSSFLENVRQEVIDNITRIRNHPSVALYCGNNENDVSWYGWGWKELYPPETQQLYEQDLKRLFHEVIPQALRQADPTRYYHPTSPIAGFNSVTPMEGDIHYWGVWHGKEPFEQYEKNVARFVSEYGFQSYPELESVQRYAEPKDMQIHSSVMLSHQRCMADERKDKEYGNRLITTYMERLFRAPKDFPSFLYVSQLLQAEGVKIAIEAHRCSMPTCMGSLYWQIDDCWPVASWSSIDYYGRWKALHYYAKRLFAPIIVVPRIREEAVDFHIVSDMMKPLQGELHVRVVDFNGETISSTGSSVSVGANTSGRYVSITKSDLCRGQDERRLFVISTLHSGSEVVSENVTYFSAPKELQLEKPDYRMEVKKVKGGYDIDLTSTRLAKSVFISCAGVEGLFSDNYFDLLPGVVKRVTFSTEAETGDIRGKLRIISLFDTYN